MIGLSTDQVSVSDSSGMSSPANPSLTGLSVLYHLAYYTHDISALLDKLLAGTNCS